MIISVCRAVWTTRTLKKPIATATDLPSLNPETNIIFSPDGAFVLTGTAGAQAGVLEGSAEAERLKDGASYGNGKVVVLNSNNLSLVKKLGEHFHSDCTSAAFAAHVRNHRYFSGFGVEGAVERTDQSGALRSAFELVSDDADPAKSILARS